ncbi:alpha/beta hydrolase [Bizionia sp.]|uniref:alpha/beta hydrolase n=1 Tax=Bizionia sp. TaxID=1954480 RepID=UPI003A93D96F
MTIKQIKFKVGEEVLDAINITKDKELPTVLMLHGAGNSNKNRLIPLAKQLFENGLGIFCFDFSGQGCSTSNKISSIQKKTDEAISALKYLNPKLKITIIAFSMSGQVAINLMLSKYKNRIENLILFAPALYDKKALEVHFGVKFSKIIRKTNSWKNNNAPEALKNFQGKLLIFFSRNDNIIPEEIPEILINSAVGTSNKKIIFLNHAPHQLAKWTSDKKENAEFVAKEILQHIMS